MDSALREAADQLGLGASFPGLDRINTLQGAQLNAAVQALLRPRLLAGAYGNLPALACLPLAAQTNLLLLLRAAPHRFTSGQRAALLAGLSQPAAGSSEAGSSIVQLLASAVAADSSSAVPSTSLIPGCPPFLLTSQPCLPWAPEWQTLAGRAAPLKQQRAPTEASAEQQQQQISGTKRQADGEAEAEVVIGGLAQRQRPDVAYSAAVPLAPAGGADEETAAVATVQAALEVMGGTQPAVTPALKAALDELLAQAAAGNPSALHTAGLSSLQDDALLMLLLAEVFGTASSFARCSAAAAGLLLPRLQRLEAPASRDLAGAVQHVGSVNPQAYVAACLKPLLSSTSLNKHHAELLAGTLKASLPPQLLPDVLAAACTPASSNHAAAAGGGAALPSPAARCAWNEHTVAVLQAVLNLKPAVTAAGVAQLAAAALGAVCSPSGVAPLAASVKFAKLLLSMVKQYPQQAAAAKQQLQAAAQACRSFMAKSLMAAVDKL
ncbi:hypothetical protein D9Q98_005882 [Chlorella vulgaris]|uniref:Fanconi Anaemia group E protein C-terminal domain-containing protein n=1 Tax=Chlorella vulgaris TaxID=3077 RepID=A0A9D4TWF5_CHLVU|nr:hypothetical protein D9Q98_005882 [Chlorella vulgaris]